MYLTENFHFSSCELEKSAGSPFLSQKSLISETVSAIVKRMKFGAHPWKKTYMTEIFHFSSCGL